MGNFEKLVVLTVLFLSAIVLAVHLNDSDGVDESDDPTSAAHELMEREAEDRDGAAGSREDESGARRGPTLLDSSVASPELDSRDEGAGRVETPSSGPGILRTEAVRPSNIPDLMIYDLEEETSWEALALELYGDVSKVVLLQNTNEEMLDAPLPGEILVPIHDYTQSAGIVADRVPLAPRQVGPARVEGPSSSETTGSRVVEGPSEAAGTQGAKSAVATPMDGVRYTVQDGDSLSRISDKFYGTKTRWKELYEANRDVLDSPDWVKPGMALVIPGVSAEDHPGVR